ncbi:MAG: DUF72 domain-containing protein [Bacteroidia bacterium]|nr:DUF72 domain-containing protein [Bacteroidia bacterium]
MVSEAKSKGLYIGTSGWSYKHWSEIFYPKDVKPDKYLEYYITKFTCVELNSSFYHLPLKTTVTGWMNRTPETFRFCTKLNRFITHQLKLVNSEGALEKYFDVFESMKDRLGPVLIQLPPALSFDKPLIHGFLDLIKNQFSLYRFAIEVRHESWINDNFFDLLAHYGIAFVIADSGDRYPFYETVTADFVYLRFHGQEQLYASDYSEADLKLYAGKIISWLDEDKEVWVFFNNDFHGFAINNAVKLRGMVYIL